MVRPRPAAPSCHPLQGALRPQPDQHLLHILLALVHFILQLLLLLGCDRLLRLAIHLPGHGQLLLFAGQMVGLLGCL